MYRSSRRIRKSSAEVVEASLLVILDTRNICARHPGGIPEDSSLCLKDCIPKYVASWLYTSCNDL
jgi:hypothetical protein